MNPVTLPEADEMAVDDKLTDEQLDMIEKSKEESWDQPPKEPDKEPEKEPEKEDLKKEPEEDLKKEDEEDELTPEQKEAAEKEDKRIEDKAKELNKTPEEVKTVETEEKAETDRIAKLAEDEEMTVEEVIESEAKDKQVAERHGNDPVKIARAMRKSQGEYDKLKTENEELKTFKTQTTEARGKFQEAEFNAQMDKDRDKLIEMYEKANPDECAELSDDAMFERSKAVIRKHFESKEAEAAKVQTETAKERRKELLKSLPKEYKEHLPEIKQLLSECGDSQVNNEKFSLVEIGNYARGKKYTPDYIKNLESQAYKRGVEQPKMIPKVKGGKPDAGSGSGKDDLTAGNELPDSEKGRAEEIYGRREGWSKERMWSEYAKNDKGEDF